MQLKHYALLVAGVVLPLGAAFFAHWDGKVTASSLAAALLVALATFTEKPRPS